MVAADLPAHTRKVGGDGSVLFVSSRSRSEIRLRSRTIKRFLGRTEIAVFEVHHPATSEERMRIELRHLGGLRRSGITADVRQGDEAARGLGERLATDTQLRSAALPLDFTRFEIVVDETGTRAQLELMGASHVAIALPPIRSYVRLYADQRDALIATFIRLTELLDQR